MKLFQMLLKQLIVWIVQQSWFQKFIADKLIQVINNSKNEADDKVYEFLFRNKRDLLAIAKRESKLTTTEIDDAVVEALQKLLDPTNTISDIVIK